MFAKIKSLLLEYLGIRLKRKSNAQKKSDNKTNTPTPINITKQPGIKATIKQREDLPEIRWKDGKGGNLWKADSESNGNPVLLLSSDYPEATRVYLTNSNRDDMFDAVFAGWHNPEQTKDGEKLRGHYRFPVSSKKIARILGNRVLLVVEFGDVTRKTIIEDVTKRID